MDPASSLPVERNPRCEDTEPTLPRSTLELLGHLLQFLRGLQLEQLLEASVPMIRSVLLQNNKISTKIKGPYLWTYQWAFRRNFYTIFITKIANTLSRVFILLVDGCNHHFVHFSRLFCSSFRSLLEKKRSYDVILQKYYHSHSFVAPNITDNRMTLRGSV